MSPPPARAVAHLDLDAFFVAVARLDDPTLHDVPVAVGDGVVASASYEARAAGVRSAMTVTEARRLCPDLAVVGVDLARCRQVADDVFGLVAATWPSAAVERRSIDECYVEPVGAGLDGLTRQVTDLRRLVADRLGLALSAGVAPNKLVAKVASGTAKPDGQLTVDDPAAFLAPLPVEALPGVGPVTAAALHSLHLHTCGAVAATDPDVLATRLSPRTATWLHRAAAGADDEPVLAPAPASSSGAQRALRPAVSDPAVIADALDALAVELAARPAIAARPPSAVTVRLRDRAMAIRSRTITLPVPSATPWSLAAAARVAAADLLATSPGPVTQVALTAEQLGSTGRRQLRLLHPYEIADFPGHLAALAADGPRVAALARAGELVVDAAVTHPTRGEGRAVSFDFPFVALDFAGTEVVVDLEHASWLDRR